MQVGLMLGCRFLGCACEWEWDVCISGYVGIVGV